MPLLVLKVSHLIKECFVMFIIISIVLQFPTSSPHTLFSNSVVDIFCLLNQVRLWLSYPPFWLLATRFKFCNFSSHDKNCYGSECVLFASTLFLSFLFMFYCNIHST